jgi:hypothetical protein
MWRARRQGKPLGIFCGNPAASCRDSFGCVLTRSLLNPMSILSGFGEVVQGRRFRRTAAWAKKETRVQGAEHGRR